MLPGGNGSIIAGEQELKFEGGHQQSACMGTGAHYHHAPYILGGCVPEETLPTISCDATTTPPTRVVSPSSISVYVSVPPQELLIFSGVAEPEWDSRSELDYAEVVVTLAPATTPYFQYTSTVSLASITNTDSDFVFAADQSWVINGSTGLELHVRIGVKGDYSLFSRFSYHVQVLTTPVKARIIGTIRWSQAALGDPNGTVNMFRVAAVAFVFDPSAPTLGGTGAMVAHERAATLTDTPAVLAGGFWAVPYAIEDVPLNEQVQVIPAFLGGVTIPPITPVFIPVPRFVTLTPAGPVAAGVDFELQGQGGKN